MKKETKYKIVTELEQALSQNNSFYLIDYKQMTAWEMVELRKTLKRHGFQLKVVKNRLALRALGDRFPELKPYFRQKTAIAMTADDPIALARLLKDFSQQGKVLEVKAGLVEAHYLSPEMFGEIVKLNSKMDLIARIGYMMSYPLLQFLRTLQAPLTNMGALLSVLKQKKES
ncbi:MAG TPA: 50S ribosomal protein L10 [Candidatus Saccharicenans sp.]|nr:50S ribosomal protein L10 [Candidatus Saccharicenans sp.]HOP61205.1 50S ribosomal protein L10 [Candidatus Saccharicenans sp.]HQM74947.1 50S ribosomal protein L10 [Candidatus Saccharicenans sp.]